MEYMAAQMDSQIEGAQLARERALFDGQGPAFPVVEPAGGDFSVSVGATLRDYFAAKAMNQLNWGAVSNYECASAAYAIADAMLLARAR